MKVILTEVVKYLGEPGDVKDVANGYARNYLLPRHLAVAATAGALKQINERKAAEGRRIAKAEEDNRTLATTIEQQTVHIKARVGAQGRLYGSITSSDIAHALSQQLGQEIDRRKVELDENIHQVGTYQVPVRLVGRLVPRVNVVVESDEARATTPSVASATAPADEANQEGETEQTATSEVITSSELQEAAE